jgi:hypothetical protein
MLFLVLQKIEIQNKLIFTLIFSIINIGKMTKLIHCEEYGCKFVTNCIACYELHMVNGGDESTVMHRTWATTDIYKIYIHDSMCYLNVPLYCKLTHKNQCQSYNRKRPRDIDITRENYDE